MSSTGALAADRPVVPVIVGATGVGKTAVAREIGARVRAAVISADSRQIYQGLDVGTAKPDEETRRRLPHYGLDVVAVGDRYSAGRFRRDAEAWLAAIQSAGRRPFIVGGTGFYVRALTEGLFDEPDMERSKVSAVRTWASSTVPATLDAWARRLDPQFAGGGTQRAGRAIEVALLTGRPLSWWQRTRPVPGLITPRFFHLVMDREALYARLLDRARRMITDGLLAETERALTAGARPSSPGLDAIGYREAIDVLEGRLAIDALPQAIADATRRYAKRQETWFRHQLTGGPVVRLEAARPAGEVAEELVQVLAKEGAV